MSDNEKDRSQQTEEATQHKIEQTREKGQVPLSKELNHWCIILGALLILTVAAPYVFKNLLQALRSPLETHNYIHSEMSLVQHVWLKIFRNVFGTMALPFGILCIAALGAGLTQTQFLISFESLKPKFSKLNPFQGLKRLFSGKSLIQFLLNVVKMLLVGALVFWLIQRELKNVEFFHLLGPEYFLGVLQSKLTVILGSLFAGVSVIAGLDVFYQRFAFFKELRMTKQEVKDEHKDIEGDPKVKQKVKQLQQERSNRRISERVPQASVILTNPTHYAVALKYDPQKSNAPTIIAKGADQIAQKIRELATENRIPVLSNPPLTRALYQNVEIDHEIPEDYYKAVAKVIRYILGLDKSYSPGSENQTFQT